ncbi:hypothetical protein DOT_2764 [Desulfosporosinus sp. OT]|nr:hypothetical protein DOT_2764 [Desulfosporosinus sp. OT]
MADDSKIIDINSRRKNLTIILVRMVMKVGKMTMTSLAKEISKD